MNNTKPILIGAIALFVIVLGAGIYAYSRGKTSVADQGNVAPAAVPASKLPAAIHSFTVSGRKFSVIGDNLGRVEIWTTSSGAPRLLGVAVISTPGPGGAGDVWTMPIPAAAHGATAVFARGYDKNGVAAARIDLTASDISKL